MKTLKLSEKKIKEIIKAKKDYNLFKKLIEEKTKQLSLIQYDKLPKGVYRNCEFTEENGKLLVEFESYSCGETDYDQFYLPLEFLFDETYPEKYKLLWKEEQRKKNEENKLKKKKEEEIAQKALEKYERKEYERLKLKFEKEKMK